MKREQLLPIGFVGERFIERVLINLWYLYDKDRSKFAEKVFLLVDCFMPQRILERMDIDFNAKMMELRHSLGQVEEMIRNYNPIQKNRVRAQVKPLLAVDAAREILRAWVNAIEQEGLYFRKREIVVEEL